MAGGHQGVKLIVGAALAAALCLDGDALAKKPPPPAPLVYDVPVTALPVTRAPRVRGYERAWAVGDFVVPSKQSVSNQELLFYGRTFEIARRIAIDYALLSRDLTPVLTARCYLGGEYTWAMFITVEKSAQAYFCGFEGKTPAEYSLEVVLPSATRLGAETGALSTSIEIDDPTRFDRRVAKMTYKGVAYEARVSSFDPDRAIRRPVTGYAIRRDGKLIGHIDLEPNGAITAPSEDAEAREAVIFFAMSLQLMPDPDAMSTQETLNPMNE
jgi:hypothetical protein